MIQPKLYKHIFLDNKYTKLYFNIISSAISKQRIKHRKTHRNYVYFEKHHILPNCIFSKYKCLKTYPWNGVLLTPREHFLCHYLLCKMTNKGSNYWESVSRAFTMMHAKPGRSKRYFNSRLYQLARKNISEIMSESQSGSGNSQFNTVWVSNVSLKSCIKITKDKLQSYIAAGFIKKRIQNWSNYKTSEEIIKIKEHKKLNEKLKILDHKLMLLNVDRQNLIDKINLHL